MEKSNKLKKDGDIHLQNKNYTEAIKKYTKTVDLIQFEDDQNFKDLIKSVYLNLTLAYLKDKNYSKVIEYSDKILNVDNVNPKAIYRKGMAHKYLKNYEEALKVFSLGINLDNN